MKSAISLNYQTIIKILGVITLIIGISMLPALLCAFIYHEKDFMNAILISMGITLSAGAITVFAVKPDRAKFRAREGYIVVALCWVVASIFGTLPYFLSGYAGNLIDAFFESVSGFTTTGCTIVDVELVPKSLLMWKAITHWLGGMGILVFVISILPALGINGQLIARAEAPGPILEKMTVRMSDSAKLLYLMYLSFTILEFILLVASPQMGIFDALINTLGSISTSGLLAHPDGIAHYNSLYVEIIIAIFMVLASINFVLYHYALERKWSYFLKDIEFRAFLRILAGAFLLCTLALYYIGQYPSFGKAMRDSFFQVVSIMTTTGVASADYTLWPTVCKMILLTLLLIGGCAASTCGSIKVIRILVLLKLIWRGFYRRMHPRSVVAVKVGGKAVPAPVVSSITVFILMYIGTLLLSCLVLSFQGLDMETTISTAVSLLSNTGIAFGEIGISGNFSLYSDPLKLYLCFLMIMGRLEIFTIVILFSRSFWGKDR